MGWTDDNGTVATSSEVGSDPEAVVRGGSMRARIKELAVAVTPWSDGSRDELVLRPILPDGVQLGTPEPTANGWGSDLSNGWSASVLDLQASKHPGGLLADFAPPGAMITFTIPAAAVITDGDGWWRPKRIQVSGRGSGDLLFALQPTEPENNISATGEPQVCPDWARGSVAVYHSTKHGNRARGPKYTTGKACHITAPTITFLAGDGQVLGHALGKYEWDNTTRVLTKAFHGSVLQPYNGAAAFVAVAADIGWTSLGGSAEIMSGSFAQVFGPYAGANGDGESITWGGYGSGGVLELAAYVDSAGSPGALVANSGVWGEYIDQSAPASFTNTIEYHLTVPVFTAGNSYWLGGVRPLGSAIVMYDSVGGFNSYFRGATNYTIFPTDPYSGALNRSNARYSIFTTVDVPVSPVVGGLLVHPGFGGGL